MGDVDQARDTKLGRSVAIEVLPPAFVDDPDIPILKQAKAEYAKLQ